MRKTAESKAGSKMASPAEPRTGHGRETLAARTLESLGSVPVQPGPLLAVLRCPGDDPDELAAAVEGSPALTARLLGVVNSAAVGTSRHIDSVRRCVIHLGAPRARTICLAFGVRILAEKSGLPPELARQVWGNCLRKAAAARLAAQLINPRHADYAYTLGLLQDIGLPMLMAVDPVFYSHEMLPGNDRGSWSQQEVERFGIDHAAVGARVLEQWDVPSRTCDAVLDHHRPPAQCGQCEGDDPLHRVTTYVASLLPHLAEEPTPREHDWLIAIHAQFLSHGYATPDAFLTAAREAADVVTGHRSAPVKLEGSHIQQMVQAVSSDCESLVSQLCQLENAMGKQREHLSHLRFQAFTDQLTKALNRRGFVGLSQRRIETAAAHKLGVCVIVIDMDDFKPINDHFGHEAGDLVLRGLAKLLRRNLDRNDLIGRLGGDEFAVQLTAVSQSKAKEIAQRLAQTCIGTRVRVTPSETVAIKMSIGAVYCDAPSADLNIDDMIAAADEAMYQRKRSGKGGLVFRRYEA